MVRLPMRLALVDAAACGVPAGQKKAAHQGAAKSVREDARHVREERAGHARV
jgi:hypothetical protein